jgi:DNA-binding SARP family transcriptional activator/type II secretory pathway predicted ATPase ExeA
MKVLREGHELALGGLRQRAVLAALLLDANHTVDVDRLIELVWDDAPPPKPIASLRAYIANLRRVLGDEQNERLITDAGGYRLRVADVPADALDIREFESLVGEGRRSLNSGDAAAADKTLAQALALWRGAPLCDFRDLEFACDESRRLESLRADAAEASFEAGLQLGRSAELITGLESEVAMNPLRERLWSQLMLALYRAGRRGEALQAYDRLHTVLESELGVRPGLALDRLAGEIRCESVDLDWTPSHTTIAATQARPWSRGGVFGRAAQFERLYDALRAAAEGRGGVVVLTGESGVGKTALAAEVADIAAAFGMAMVWAGHAGGVHKTAMSGWQQVLRALANEMPAAGLELAEATAAAVAELAGQRPTVVVLDDLHRADRATHEVLGLLAAAIHRRSMLIIATWQDGGGDIPVRARAFDRLLGRCDITTIKLRGLDDTAIAQLVENVGGVVPTAEMVAAIRTRTGGNPFYVRELTRLLLDSGRLDASTTDIDGDDVPDAVAGVVRRRMGDLTRSARSALLAAAILGVEFGAVPLATVLGAPVAETTAWLELALRIGLLVEVADRPGHYRFPHGLVRDAVAAQLTGLARSQVHAEIARAYDAGSPSPAESLVGAEHAWRAGGELDPGIALRLIDRALAAARARSAYHEVAELSRRALDVCTRLPADAERFHREAGLWLHLASVEAVVKGQTSAEALDALRGAYSVMPTP